MTKGTTCDGDGGDYENWVGAVAIKWLGAVARGKPLAGSHGKWLAESRGTRQTVGWEP